MEAQHARPDCEAEVVANRLLVTDTQHQVAASRRMLLTGQRRR